MEACENQIRIGNDVRSSRAFGLDYLAEFRRVLSQHVKPVTRAFLEWGAGHATLDILQMRDRLAIDHFFSIDDNKDYLDQLVAQFPAWSGFHPYCCDLTGPIVNDRDQELNYSNFPLGFDRRFAFIFIDGRRRLECALVASLLCHPDTVVVLHDYRRSRYQPVKVIYDIVEDGPQFRVMRLRKDLHAAERMRGLQAA
jgi:hypothetical protein